MIERERVRAPSTLWQTVDAKSQVIFSFSFSFLPPLISCYCKQMAVQFPAKIKADTMTTMQRNSDAYEIVYSKSLLPNICRLKVIGNVSVLSCWTRRILHRRRRCRHFTNGYEKFIVFRTRIVLSIIFVSRRAWSHHVTDSFDAFVSNGKTRSTRCMCRIDSVDDFSFTHSKWVCSVVFTRSNGNVSDFIFVRMTASRVKSE